MENLSCIFHAPIGDKKYAKSCKNIIEYYETNSSAKCKPHVRTILLSGNWNDCFDWWEREKKCISTCIKRNGSYMNSDFWLEISVYLCHLSGNFGILWLFKLAAISAKISHWAWPQTFVRNQIKHPWKNQPTYFHSQNIAKGQHVCITIDRLV